MRQKLGKNYSVVEADEGKYLVEKGQETAAKLVRAIYFGGYIPELEEKPIEE